MVESIKGRDTSSRPQTKSSSDSLRTSFKSISSGLSVSNAPTKPNDQGGKDNRSVNAANEVAQKLSDAASYSTLALKSVEQLATQSTDPNTASAVPKELAGDLEKLRKDINTVVNVLREKAAKAEVLNENLESSDARLGDVRAAEDHAATVGARINYNEEQALKAHARLNPNAVAQLLEE